MFWSAPRAAWRGETAFVLACGPSLAALDAERLKGRGRVVAIKNAGLPALPGQPASCRAPWADILYWADPAFGEDNRDRLALFTGAARVTRLPPAKPLPVDVKVMRHETHQPLAIDPSALAGFCSTAQAINLAAHHGPARIVVMGLDMQPTGRFHGEKKRQPRPDIYTSRMIPSLRRMAAALANVGIAVINATPGSALDCWPIVHPDEVLG